MTTANNVIKKAMEEHRAEKPDCRRCGGTGHEKPTITDMEVGRGPVKVVPIPGPLCKDVKAKLSPT